MGQWVRCTLSSGEKFGEAKLVRHINLDYYLEMERQHDSTVLRGPGMKDLSVTESPKDLISQTSVE